MEINTVPVLNLASLVNFAGKLPGDSNLAALANVNKINKDTNSTDSVVVDVPQEVQDAIAQVALLQATPQQADARSLLELSQVAQQYSDANGSAQLRARLAALLSTASDQQQPIVITPETTSPNNTQVAQPIAPIQKADAATEALGNTVNIKT